MRRWVSSIGQEAAATMAQSREAPATPITFFISNNSSNSLNSLTRIRRRALKARTTI